MIKGAGTNYYAFRPTWKVGHVGCLAIGTQSLSLLSVLRGAR